MPKSWEADLGFSVLMGSNSRDPDPGNSGCLSLGPHDGGKATPTRSHPDFHVLLKERQRWLIGKIRSVASPDLQRTHAVGKAISRDTHFLFLTGRVRAGSATGNRILWGLKFMPQNKSGG